MKRKSPGHTPLERRLKTRATNLRNRGRSENQSGEMLDLYLDGNPVADISEAYEVSKTSVYQSMCKEALFRLMRDRQVERLEEVKEIVEGDTQ